MNSTVAIRLRFAKMAGFMACRFVLGSSCYAFVFFSNRMLFFFFLFISFCHLMGPPVS